MRELQQQVKDKTVIVGQSEVNKHQELLSRLRLHRGQQGWQYDLTTTDVVPAEVQVLGTLKGVVQRKIVVKPNCLYCVAINKRNAQRKFIKQLDKLIKHYAASKV